MAEIFQNALNMSIAAGWLILAVIALRLLLLLKHFRGQPSNKCRNKKRQRRDEHDNNGDSVVDGFKSTPPE